MINLLPPDRIRQIHAGQDNVVLLRYCLASLILTIPLAGLVIFSHLTLTNQRNEAEKTISDNLEKAREFSIVQQSATEFQNNLRVAKTILDKEVRYTNAALTIARALPSNIILQSLNLDSSSFGEPIVLTALGKNNYDAVRLKTAFENSPSFSEAHLISVSSNQDANNGYNVNISISVVISPEIAKP